jgi:hypothetical protein
MDGSSCGFDRARSCPAKITKGAKEGGLLPESLKSTGDKWKLFYAGVAFTMKMNSDDNI